jgi:GntR family transcriptional regulator
MPRGIHAGPEKLAGAVRQEIVKRIEEGAWRPRERLPAEPMLAASLGVSRATLRDALRSLEEDGFVTRVRGAGTFVTHRPRLKNNLDVNFGVTDLIRSMGMVPGTEGLKVYEAVATGEEARLLSVPNGSPVVCVERVRTADGRPVVFSVDLIPASLFEGGIETAATLGQGSIYEVLERELGVAVRQGVATVRPAKADRALGAALRVPRGSLLLYLRQVDYDPDGRAVLLSHEHHLADVFEVTVVRRGSGVRAKEGA